MLNGVRFVLSELSRTADPLPPTQAGMIALQRLFALMIHTRRSFLHVSEIVKNLPDIDDIARPGTHAVYALSGELGSAPLPTSETGS